MAFCCGMHPVDSNRFGFWSRPKTTCRFYPGHLALFAGVDHAGVFIRIGTLWVSHDPRKG